MVMVKRVFQTREQALDVYRSQLSQCLIFIETFEPERVGSVVRVGLEIIETRQSISLEAKVSAVVGKREAVERGYGQRAGMLLEVVLSAEIVEPLRTFFLTEAISTRAKPSVGLAEASEIRPFSAQCMSSEETASAEVERFLGLTETASLFALFGLGQGVERQQLRLVYNQIVRELHPDAQVLSFNVELKNKLELAYQVLNEVYALLQHPIERAIYLEVSQLEQSPLGLSYTRYKAWQSAYRQEHSANIRMSNTLLERVLESRSLGDHSQAERDLRLALQYDPFNAAARALIS